MWPTDHVQMVTSWCELTLRCVDWVGIRRCLGRLSDIQYISIAIAIASTSDRSAATTAGDRLMVQLSIYIYLLSTLVSATIFGFLQFLRLHQTVADCCKVWHFSRYISLAIWIHSELLSLVSVAPRLYECSYTYSIQGEYEVASSPGSEHSRLLYAHDLWSYYNSPCSRARLPLYVTCCLPPDFLLLSLCYKGCSL